MMNIAVQTNSQKKRVHAVLARGAASCTLSGGLYPLTADTMLEAAPRSGRGRRIFWSVVVFATLCNTAQAADVLSRRIDVVFKETPLTEALQVVAKRAGFEWSYNANILDGSRRANLIANDWTVRETLYEILGQGYEFKTNGNYLILKKRKKPAEQLSGYVKDPVTGRRLANATVYDRETLRATTTDSTGYYELKVRKNTEVVVARLDYKDTILTVTSQTPRYQKVDLQINTTPQPRSRKWEENLQIVATKAEKFFKATLPKWNALNLPDSLHRRGQISFLPALGTNHTLSAQVTNDWSLNVLAGTSQANRRLEVAGLSNFTKTRVEGVQVAGVFNELHGNMDGVQVAGVYNHCGDTLRGVQVAGIINLDNQASGAAAQIAGIANHVRGGVAILQVAGLYNRMRGGITGLQAAGLFNSTRDTVLGMQVAGLFNQTACAYGSQVAGFSNNTPSGILGLQVSGFHNRAAVVDGVQVSGFVNRADTIVGIQVSGAVNHAKKVKGVQIGLFNSAKTLDGLQIGLLNRSGRRVLPLINW